MIQQEMLTYQQLNREFNRIERDLRKSKAYLTMKECKAKRQEYEAELVRLDAKAGDLKNRLAQAKQTIAEINNIIDEHTNEIAHVETSDELKYMNKKLDEQLKILASCENDVRDILREGEEIAKLFDKINSELPAIVKAYKTASEEFEAEKEKVKPRVKELREQMDALKPSLDKKLFEMYERISAGKVFPVFVPLQDGNRCGGCRMDMPNGVVETQMQKNNGLMRCEHCGRIIYQE